MKRNRMRNEDMPTRSSSMEQAEGSRENIVNSSDRDGSNSNAGGISNRPLDQEQDEQEHLPERGRSKSER